MRRSLTTQEHKGMKDSTGQKAMILAMGVACGPVAYVWGPWLAVAVVSFVAASVTLILRREEARRSPSPPG
jgi:hypothetical protein